MMLTVDKLRAMQEDIMHDIYAINSGGCVHFAYYFSKKLREHNISHKIFLTNVWNKINTTYETLESISHVSVYIPEIGYVDGEDTFSCLNARKYRKHTYMSLKKLDYYRYACEWNPDYNVRQNAKLEKIIDRHFKKWQKKSTQTKINNLS